MEKLLYLVLHRDFNAPKAEGIKKKILSQSEAFKNIGFETDLLYILKDGIYINGDKKYHFSNFKINYYINLFKLLEKVLEKKEYKIIYIRRFPHINYFSFFSFLNKLKGKKVLEIPTYPFNNEVKDFKLKIVQILEKYYFIKNKKSFEFLTYFGEPTDEIFQIKAIELQNGIDINKMKIQNKKKIVNEINFIGVAGLYYWHGYDRLIKAIKKYNEVKLENKIDIKFHIVGTGEPIFSDLKKLVEDLKLENRVIFYGHKNGKELDEIFEKADIGVDSLGRHRSGNEYNSSLKSKEYIARGLPLIKSHKDKMLEGKDFIYSVSSDEEIFDLNLIINWFKEKKFSAIDLRDYAKQNMSWENEMYKIKVELENTAKD